MELNNISLLLLSDILQAIEEFKNDKTNGIKQLNPSILDYIYYKSTIDLSINNVISTQKIIKNGIKLLNKLGYINNDFDFLKNYTSDILFRSEVINPLIEELIKTKTIFKEFNPKDYMNEDGSPIQVKRIELKNQYPNEIILLNSILDFRGNEQYKLYTQEKNEKFKNTIKNKEKKAQKLSQQSLF